MRIIGEKGVCRVQKFEEIHSLFYSFRKSIEKDFFIQAIGYDNFRFIMPYRTFRIQKFYTLHVILAGSGTVKLGEVSCPAKAGELFFLPPELPIMYYPNRDDLWQYVWFELTGVHAGAYGRMLGFSADTPVVSQKGKAVEAMYGLVRKMDEKTAGYYDALSAFYAVLGQNSTGAEAKPESFSGMVISYLHRHYQNPQLCAEEICRAFRISHSYLCRLMKQETGKPMIQHLIEIRISEACRMLEKTQMSVKEISYSVGFRDELHFMKTFKRQMKISPREYRRGLECGKNVYTI